jgi:O-antigen/teichoic acid export membrane protein
VYILIAQLSVPVHRVRGFLFLATSDSLLRNSLYLMASTVVTAGLGYVFWAIAAHVFTSVEIGIGGAVISLCSTIALLTYLGSWATLIERLPAYECSSTWTTVLVRVCVSTAVVTGVATAVAVPILVSSKDYSYFFKSPSPVLIAVVGAASWTLVNLFSAVFIAARRAGRLLSIQTLISVAKVLFIVPLAAAGAGAVGLVEAWVASAVLGVAVGALWLIPQMGLGSRPGRYPRQRRRATTTQMQRCRRPRHRRPVRPNLSLVRRLIGQHLTSVGGAATPLLLPVLVVVRLGATSNAYFYITWMIGGIFFMVSPSVAAALFAESVRVTSDLRNVVAKALRLIAIILIPAMAVMVIGGKLILGLFGASYATAGYGLLIFLAISAVPDAVSNVAVAVFRVTERIGYSATLNTGILIATVIGAWLLMPPLGIVGVGVAWLGAQTLGAMASLPAYTHGSMAA